MPRDIEPPRCVGCHLSNYTKDQIEYAEKNGTPLTEASQIYCHYKREYVFKNDSCKHYTERHEEIR